MMRDKVREQAARRSVGGITRKDIPMSAKQKTLEIFS